MPTQGIGLGPGLGRDVGGNEHPVQHLHAEQMVDHGVHLHPISIGGRRVVMAGEEGPNASDAEQSRGLDRLIAEVVVCLLYTSPSPRD